MSIGSLVVGTPLQTSIQDRSVAIPRDQLYPSETGLFTLYIEDGCEQTQVKNETRVVGARYFSHEDICRNVGSELWGRADHEAEKVATRNSVDYFQARLRILLGRPGLLLVHLVVDCRGEFPSLMFGCVIGSSAH